MSQPSTALTPRDLADLRRLVKHHGSKAAASNALCLSKGAAGRILRVGRCDPSTLRRIRAYAGRLRDKTRAQAHAARPVDLAKPGCELEEAKADRLALEAEVSRLRDLLAQARSTAEANQESLRVLSDQHTELLKLYEHYKDRAAHLIAEQAEVLLLLSRGR